MHRLTASFQERITNTFGEAGRRWLSLLPSLISECEKKFNIRVGDAHEHLSHNYVAEAILEDNSRAIIKFCVHSEEVAAEINALNIMRGSGIVNLIDSDEENGILLLEKLCPGVMLCDLGNDHEATLIAADLMRKIWREVPSEHHFKTTQAWFEKFDFVDELPFDFSVSLVDRAKKIGIELHQSLNKPVLLHGDLHHFNILSAEREPWLVIDPKGVIGECEYEVGAFLRNPIPQLYTSMDTHKVLLYRVDQFAEVLGFDRQKIIGWGFAQAVLAALWALEADSSDWRMFLKCAEVFSKVK